MNVQSVNYSTPSFGALKFNKNVPDLLKDSVNKSKAFKKFGDNFNAEVEYLPWSSGKIGDSNVYPSIMLKNIKPANLWTKLKMKKAKITPDEDDMFYFGVKTHQIPTDEHLAEKIENLPTSYLMNKFKATFSRNA